MPVCPLEKLAAASYLLDNKDLSQMKLLSIKHFISYQRSTYTGRRSCAHWLPTSLIFKVLIPELDAADSHTERKCLKIVFLING